MSPALHLRTTCGCGRGRPRAARRRAAARCDALGDDALWRGVPLLADGEHFTERRASSRIGSRTRLPRRCRASAAAHPHRQHRAQRPRRPRPTRWPRPRGCACSRRVVDATGDAINGSASCAFYAGEHFRARLRRMRADRTAVLFVGGWNDRGRDARSAAAAAVALAARLVA